MKTYLITGGAGFIGSNFVDFILTKYSDVKLIVVDKLTYAGNLNNLKAHIADERLLFFQYDICDRISIEKLFNEYEVDYVINFAAESHVDRSISNPNVFVETNVNGTLNLLNAAKKSWCLSNDIYKKGVKFLQVSTDEVYGSLGKEGFFIETTPLSPHSPYSASKAAADLIVMSFYDTYKFPINITRCSNNYGPYQFPEKLIPLAINKLINNSNVPIYGDGSNIRDWLYVEDHCIAIDRVLDKGKIGEVYNIGGHNEKSNIEIVRFLIEYLHTYYDSKINTSLIEYVEDRKGHDLRYGIEPKKIKEELGWTPCTDFSTGIVKTVKWYIDNNDWLSDVMDGSYRNLKWKN